MQKPMWCWRRSKNKLKNKMRNTCLNVSVRSLIYLVVKRRRSNAFVVAVLVLILNPIRGVAMNQLIEVRPLLQILVELHNEAKQHATSKRNRFEHYFREKRLHTLLRHLVVAGVESRRCRRWSIADLGFFSGESWWTRRPRRDTNTTSFWCQTLGRVWAKWSFCWIWKRRKKHCEDGESERERERSREGRSR